MLVVTNPRRSVTVSELANLPNTEKKIANLILELYKYCNSTVIVQAWIDRSGFDVEKSPFEDK